jgi:hypothetical protein
MAAMRRQFPFRGVTGATLSIGLLAFLLPFAGVSCGGHPALTASGVNAAFGGQYTASGQQHYSGDVTFLLAMLGIIVAVACQFLRVRQRARALAGGAGSLWSLVMLLVGQAHVNAEFSNFPGHVLTVTWEVGFWLAVGAMGLCTLLAALELNIAGVLWAPAGTAESGGSPPLPRLAAFPPGGTGTRSPAVTLSGALAVVAGVTIIGACALPYIHYTDQGSQPASPSIFNPGFAPSNWFAAEPVVVGLLAIVAGVALMRWMNPIPRAIAAAVLIAYGAQTFLLFLGYVYLALNSSSAQLGPGGVVGLIAGVLLLAAGIAPVRSLFDAPASAAATAAGGPA